MYSGWLDASPNIMRFRFLNRQGRKAIKVVRLLIFLLLTLHFGFLVLGSLSLRLVGLASLSFTFHYLTIMRLVQVEC